MNEKILLAQNELANYSTDVAAIPKSMWRTNLLFMLNFNERSHPSTGFMIKKTLKRRALLNLDLAKEEHICSWFRLPREPTPISYNPCMNEPC